MSVFTSKNAWLGGFMHSVTVRRLGAASFSLLSCRCCPHSRWCEPAYPAELSMSSLTPERPRSLCRATVRAAALCGSSAASGCTPATWNISSTFSHGRHPSIGDFVASRLERCAAPLLSPSSAAPVRIAAASAIEPDPKALGYLDNRQQRTVFESDNGRSALFAGTRLYAPQSPFARCRGGLIAASPIP